MATGNGPGPPPLVETQNTEKDSINNNSMSVQKNLVIENGETQGQIVINSQGQDVNENLPSTYNTLDSQYPNPGQDSGLKRSVISSDSEGESAGNYKKRSLLDKEDDNGILDLDFNLLHNDDAVSQTSYLIDSSRNPMLSESSQEHNSATEEMNPRTELSLATEQNLLNTNFSDEDRMHMENNQPILQTISICMKSVNNMRIFNNPKKNMQALEQWDLKSYVVPNTMHIPGNGNALVIDIKVDQAICELLFKSRFKFGPNEVTARKIDNNPENINFVKVGTFDDDVTIEEILEDIRLDNNSPIYRMSWMNTESPRRNNRTLKIRVAGPSPKYAYIMGVRYPTRPLPVPMLRCHFCLDIGHSDITCSRTQPRCYQCSESHKKLGKDPEHSCQKAAKCFQCQGAHPPTSNQCPKNQAALKLHKQLLEENTPLKDINRKLRELKYPWTPENPPQPTQQSPHQVNNIVKTQQPMTSHPSIPTSNHFSDLEESDLDSENMNIDYDYSENQWKKVNNKKKRTKQTRKSDPGEHPTTDQGNSKNFAQVTQMSKPSMTKESKKIQPGPSNHSSPPNQDKKI